MENKVNKLIKLISIPEIIIGLGGILLVVSDDFTAEKISIFIALIIILKGILFIRSYSCNIKKYNIFEMVMPYGITNILYGLLIVANIYTLKLDLNYVVGFYLVLSSLIYLYVIFKLPKLIKEIKVLLLISMVLIAVVGTIFYTNILTHILFFNKVCGFSLIIYGLLNYLAITLIKKNIITNIEIEKNKEEEREKKNKTKKVDKTKKINKKK